MGVYLYHRKGITPTPQEEMNMIHHIVRFTNKNRVLTQVHYTNGRKYEYTEKDNLPMTVLKILLDGICETQYTETGKVERFREV